MEVYFKMFFFVIILIAFAKNSHQDDAPIVEISTGKIQGEDKESRDDRDFFAYRGIPYAKAKRFEPPQKPDNWTDVRDATDYGKKCIQYSTYEKKVVGQEDCLFINVFTPKIGDGISKKLLPVIIFFHGSFMDGTSEIYRPHYFQDQDVVIVTFNHRINVFGFLSTGDNVVNGNMGLKDQVMALHWVQENIRKFAGDPNKVTIMGAGDGASSVHLLMLSPTSKGLFRKAITQSGNALKLSVIQRRPKEAAQRLARLLDCGRILNETENATKTSDCSWNNSSLILECLKLVDAKKLASVQKEAFHPLRDSLAFFGPVIEKPPKDSLAEIPFLTEHPYSIISSGRQIRVPWMAGLNAQEGLITTGVIMTDKSFVDQVDAHWNLLSPQLLKYDASRSDITDSIRKFYLSGKNYNFINSPPSSPLQPVLISNYSTLPHQSYYLSNQTQTMYPSLSHSSYPHRPQVQPAIQMPLQPAHISAPTTADEVYTINFEEQFKSFTDLFTDRYYAAPMYDSVEMQSKYSPLYVYYNTYEGQFSLLDVYTGKTQEPAPAMKKVSNWFKKNILGRKIQAPKHMGVCNGDELPLFFKYPELKIKENTKDYGMSKELVKLWVQFANDETKMSFYNSTWLPVNLQQGNLQVMQIGNTPEECGFKEIGEKLLTRMKFWSTLKYLAPFDQ